MDGIAEHEAKFRRSKRIEDFDFSANSHVTPEVINTVTEPAWVAVGQPLRLIGDSGTGKTHLLIGGIGTAIAEAGLKVRYTTTTKPGQRAVRGRQRDAVVALAHVVGRLSAAAAMTQQPEGQAAATPTSNR